MTDLRTKAAVDGVQEAALAFADAWQTPALALALVTRDGVLAELSLGATSGARFQIGSISKTVTAMGILTQVQRGRLHLDDDVAQHLPWLAGVGDGEPIRLRHLLSHTAGLPADDLGVPPSACGLAALAVSGRSRPGVRYAYSNLGFTALGAILARTAGAPYGEAVEQLVLRPLGAAGASGSISEARRDLALSGHAPAFEERPWLPDDGWAPVPWFPCDIDGGIVASAAELATVARALLCEGSPLLRRESYGAMVARHATCGSRPRPGPDAYGFGIQLHDRDFDGVPCLVHGGSMPGHRADLAADPAAGVAAVVMTNSTADVRPLTVFAIRAMRRAVAKAPSPAQPASPRFAPCAIERRERFVGTYRAVDGDAATLRFAATEGGLVVESGGHTAPVSRNPGGQRAKVVPRAALLTSHPQLGGDYLLFARPQGGRFTELFHSERRFVADGADAGAAHAPRHRRVTGLYRSFSPWVPAVELRERGGRLFAADHELRPLGDGEYRISDDALVGTLRFDLDLDGRASRLRWGSGAYIRTSGGHRWL